MLTVYDQIEAVVYRKIQTMRGSMLLVGLNIL